MLDQYYCVLVESPQGKDKEDLQTNWLDIKNDLCELLDYRLSTSHYCWYDEKYLECLLMIDRFTPQEASSVNLLPQGILAEVFFLNACRQNGIPCRPCCGEDDADGTDFILSDCIGEKFIDVTINGSQRNLRRKVKAGSFPTLFLPWTYKAANSQHPSINYAHEYMRSGGFDGREFLERALKINTDILRCLKREVFRNERVKDERIFGKHYSDFTGSDYRYIYDMEEVLCMIKGNM